MIPLATIYNYVNRQKLTQQKNTFDYIVHPERLNIIMLLYKFFLYFFCKQGELVLKKTFDNGLKT